MVMGIFIQNGRVIRHPDALGAWTSFTSRHRAESTLIHEGARARFVSSCCYLPVFYSTGNLSVSGLALGQWHPALDGSFNGKCCWLHIWCTLKSTGLCMGDHSCLIGCLLVGKILAYLFNQPIVAFSFHLKFVLLIWNNRMDAHKIAIIFVFERYIIFHSPPLH